eukprot:6211990-Pleurochrysis_carterae.AAC.10
MRPSFPGKNSTCLTTCSTASSPPLPCLKLRSSAPVSWPPCASGMSGAFAKLSLSHTCRNVRRGSHGRRSCGSLGKSLPSTPRRSNFKPSRWGTGAKISPR